MALTYPYQPLTPLSELLAAPLEATVIADGMAAQAFVDFVRRYGFDHHDPLPPKLNENASEVKENRSDDQLGKLKMVTFWYTYPLEGQEHIAQISLPLLSLVNLPLLQVGKATFGYDVTTGLMPEPIGPLPPFAPLSVEPPRQALRPMAMGTYTPSSQKGNMHVQMEMKVADMPGGISSLLQILSSNVYKSLPQTNS